MERLVKSCVIRYSALAFHDSSGLYKQSSFLQSTSIIILPYSLRSALLKSLKIFHRWSILKNFTLCSCHR